MNHPDPSFDPEDPQLTAYALGELSDPADRAAVEQTLQSSPEARAALREIRELTAALTAEYEQERALADGNAAPNPLPNVVPMPLRNRPAWPRRLLLAAAVLLLLASVARLVVRDQKTDHVATTIPHGTVAEQSVAGQQPPPQNPPAQVAAQAEGHVSKVPQSPHAPIRPREIPFPLPIADSGTHISLAGTPSATAPPLSAAPPLTLLDGKLLAQADAPLPFPAQAGQVTAHEYHKIETRGVATTSPDTPDQSSMKDSSRAMPSASVINSRGSGSRLIAQAKSAAAMPAPLSDSPADPADRRSFDEDALKSSFATTASAGAMLTPSQRGIFNTAVYEHLTENPFLAAKDNPLSTFSIDVDTASYANVRRFIDSGSLPPPDAVRVEELVNYFPYDYAPPAPGDEHPFAVHLEAASCPWNPQDRLVRIGIKGREMASDKRPPSNLVFLLDVSGSMEPPERLPLIKAAMGLLVEQLTENDRVAIVTYAGESGVALPSTTGDHKDEILRVLDGLRAGGSTNGASGIKRAYQVARDHFIKGGTNRVILATDGDFNVGVTGQGDLVRLIEDEAKSGVALSALGVGTDNYKDATMQKLADKGHGNYAYIDKLDEARKVLVEQMSGTLVTIAKDVKIQVEFNPATVAAYRLVGYEKRMLRKEDFNDDRIDGGDIGASHRVTALYEVVPVGTAVPGATPAVDALKYGNVPVPPLYFMATPTPANDRRSAAPKSAGELLTVKMRHKAPDGDTSERSYEESLTDHAAPGDFANASPDFKFAAAVASFGLVLRDSPYKGGATLGAAIELAQDGKGTDPGAYRAGFIELAQHAQAIQQARGE